jgi:hypothetical protein
MIWRVAGCWLLVKKATACPQQQATDNQQLLGGQFIPELGQCRCLDRRRVVRYTLEPAERRQASTSAELFGLFISFACR